LNRLAFCVLYLACYTLFVSDLEQAKRIFQAGDYSFVLVRDAQLIAAGKREGIGELLDAVEHHRDAVRGAALADKIVGKAVALVAAYAAMGAVYTPLGSQPAEAVLGEHGIPCQAERVVPVIRNKRNDDLCPLERLTTDLHDPAKAVDALHEFVRSARVGALKTSQVAVT
jgi:hypothetical protein